VGDIREFLLAVALLTASMVAARALIGYFSFFQTQNTLFNLIISLFLGAAIYAGIVLVWAAIEKRSRQD